MKSWLGRQRIADLDITHPHIFTFLDSVQPYNPNYSWMAYLRDFANEKHMRLTPQKKLESNRITIRSSNSFVSIGGGTTINTHGWNEVYIAGRRLAPGQRITAASNRIDFSNNTEGLTVEKNTWVSFLLGDTQINAIWLCKTAVNEGETILRRFSELF